MKSSIQIKTLSLALIASCAVGSSSAFAAAISFNSRGATSGGMGAGDTAGAPGVNVGNWNNMNTVQSSPDGAIVGSIAAGNVVDDGGAIVASMVTSWSGSGVATAAGGGTNDAFMWSSEWDLFETNNPGPIDMTITVTNVPYAEYDVYFYVDDASDTNTRGGDVIANGSLKSITMFNSSTGGYTEADSAFTWNATNTEVGSYLRIQGVTGSTLTLEMDARNSPTSRLRMSGFQIVEVPEPSFTSLLGVSGVFLLLRRRRK